MKWFTILTAALVMLTAAPAKGAEKVSMKGEIIDTTCYFTAGERGKGHKKCARMCLKKGIPAALLTDDDKVYLLLPSHDNEVLFKKVKDLAAERVEIKGEKIEKGGTAAIVVEGIEELKE